jgi:hypothetical protein
MSITTLMRGMAGLLWLLAQSTWALSCYEGVGESAYAGSREMKFCCRMALRRPIPLFGVLRT